MGVVPLGRAIPRLCSIVESHKTNIFVRFACRSPALSMHNTACNRRAGFILPLHTMTHNTVLGVTHPGLCIRRNSDI